MSRYVYLRKDLERWKDPKSVAAFGSKLCYMGSRREVMMTGIANTFFFCIGSRFVEEREQRQRECRMMWVDTPRAGLKDKIEGDLKK